MTVAAIYLPEGRDIHYHAWTGCTQGGVRIRGERYHVNTEEHCKLAGKLPCPNQKCWHPFGYIVEWELEAVR